MRSPTGVALREMRPGEPGVGVEGHTGIWCVDRRGVHVVPTAGPGWLRLTGIPREDELGGDIKSPEGGGDLEARDDLTPTSAPFVRTSGLTFWTGSPVVGETVIVDPRASLLWKPYPLLK